MLIEVGRVRSKDEMIKLGKMIIQEAEEYKRDIIVSMEKTYIKMSKPHFLPVIIGVKELYPYMTVNTDASYANYHLYSDLLHAGFLDKEKADAVIKFREKRGGELLGMSRFAGWLDDWPAVGYGWAFINYDYVDKLLMLYYGHMAHHQNRGTFLAYESINFKDVDRKGRLPKADHRIPSTLVVPHLTRLMLIFEERDRDIVWLNKAAPRRWFEDGKEIRVQDAVTRFGRLSYNIKSQISQKIIICELSIPEDFKANIYLRLRPPNGYKIQKVELNDKEWLKFDVEKEIIVIPRVAKRDIKIKVYY